MNGGIHTWEEAANKSEELPGGTRNSVLLDAMVTKGGEDFRRQRSCAHWIISDFSERALVI